MILHYNKKSIKVNVKKISNFGMIFGLMFRTRKTKNLLFEISSKKCSSLTSLFVFFPFLIIWLDEKNKIIKWEIVKSFRLYIKSPKTFESFVEFPLNEENKKIIKFLVGKERFKY